MPPIRTPRLAFVAAFVAGCSLAIAACQPSNDAAERAGRHVDRAAKKIGQQVDKAADKPKNVLAGDAPK